MAVAHRKDQALNFRVSSADKAVLLRAAAQVGQDITTFVVEPALARAIEVNKREQVTVITPDIRERFVSLITSPPPPSASLTKRLSDKRHRLIDA